MNGTQLPYITDCNMLLVIYLSNLYAYTKNRSAQKGEIKFGSVPKTPLPISSQKLVRVYIVSR